MDDLISRQDTIREIVQKASESFWNIEATGNIIYILQHMPSAQPKKGRWIEYEKGIKITSYKCSECGRIVRDDTGYEVSEDYPFCHCGADMRGKT